MDPDASDSAIALALLASPGVGERTLSRWLAWNAARGEPPAQWIGAPREDLIRAFPDKTESIGRAFARLEAGSIERAAQLINRLHRSGGQVLLVTHADYPRSIRDAYGDAAPPVLSVVGDCSLFDRAAGAVVGTRTPSEAGATLAGYCARWMAARGRPVVSGGAPGIDTRAHEEALDAGGATIVVLPQGILTYPVAGVPADAIDRGAALLVSQFLPDAPWTTGGAVTRNETIAALARLVCVIEPHSPGGSLKTGRDALRQGKRVLAYSGAGSTGSALLREGARPLLGPGGRFTDDYIDGQWQDAVRDAPAQIELL